jgi:hypothetical protein
LSNHPFVVLPLFADAGIPMILLTWPAMMILLVPIILIEGFLCRKWLGLKTWQAVKTNTVSNLASTIIGIPIAWAIMLAVEFATFGTMSLVDKIHPIQDWHSPIANVIFFLLGSAWVAPTEGRDRWLVPSATLVLLVPFFFVSYWIEYRVVRRMVGRPDGEEPNLSYPRIRTAVRNANLVTYAAIFPAVSEWLGILLRRR